MDLQPIQVPRALMDILMFEHDVHYGQTVICTKKNFTTFRFRWSKPFLQITPVLSLKSPSRTMESPDGASPSTWAPWTKAWPPPSIKFLAPGLSRAGYTGPLLFLPVIGPLNRSLSASSLRTNLPWETLQGGKGIAGAHKALHHVKVVIHRGDNSNMAFIL